MKKYNAYKDTEIQELGKIPKEWNINRLASFGYFGKGRGISKKDLKNKGLPTILYGDLYTKYEIKAIDIINKVNKETALNSIPISNGDLLFSGSGETLEDIGKAITYLGNEVVYVGGDAIIYKKKNLDSLFLSYCLSAPYTTLQKIQNAKGNIIYHVYASRLRNINIAFPPAQDQPKIANYLDQKAQAIDQKIKLLQQKMLYYLEYKKSLVNETICRGLDKNVKLMDSGVEWIGKIPEHWEVKRLHDITSGLTGFPFSSKEYKEEGIKLVRGINVKEGKLDWSSTVFWSKVSNPIKKYLLKANDVLIQMDGSKVGKNFCIVRKDDLPLLLLQRVTRLRANKNLIPKFLYYSISFGGFYDWVSIVKSDPLVPHISLKNIFTYVIPFAPIKEQIELVEYLDSKTKSINKITANLKQQIDYLKQLRKTLINDVVTGKINVI